MIESGINSAIVWKKDLIANLHTLNNIEKLKQNLMKETSAQNFMVIRYQRKVLNAFDYRYYWLILFL